MLQTAMELADKLNIKDNQDVIVHIKRLPPSFSQKGEFTTIGTHTIYLESDGIGSNQNLYIYNN